MRALRCAIYTRKSSEEGLDQAFNSLDAQFEAGRDYIRSQKHQGWQQIKQRYDDGGYSGGTMKRPGLEQLFEDIRRGHVDVVVVYKVDRLSRALGDFAEMMRLFDEHGISFVSVTQQFNTTSSMGRLTLNMLLSFAQFEREVTGERIRDKIAATRKKGLWVGGPPPLGYRLDPDSEDRKLHVIPEEAELVRACFDGYIQDQSLVALAARLNERGHTTKRWRSKKGRWRGGIPLSTKYIYRVLTNPLYIGRITHTRDGKTQEWPGQHEPIVERAVWDRVQELIERQDRDTRHRWTHAQLLKGKLRTHDGDAMSPGSVQRARRDGSKRLVRYYVSQRAIKLGYGNCEIKTVNARHLDDLLRAIVLDHLRDESIEGLEQAPSETLDHWVRAVISSVTLAPERLLISLSREQVEACRREEWGTVGAEGGSTQSTCPYQPEVTDWGDRVELTLDIRIKKIDGRRLLVSPEGHDLVRPAEPEPQPHIVRAIGLAYRWHEALLGSKSISAVAREEGISEGRVRRLLPLTHLGPKLLKRALTGDLPTSVTLNDLLAAAEHFDWSRQLDALGLGVT